MKTCEAPDFFCESEVWPIDFAELRGLDAVFPANLNLMWGRGFHRAGAVISRRGVAEHGNIDAATRAAGGSALIRVPLRKAVEGTIRFNDF